MPYLTYPMSPDGPVVPVMFGMDRTRSAALAAAGQPIPRPIAGRALIDSGSDVTIVAAHILSALGLPPHLSASTQSTTGSASVNLFDASLSILAPPGAGVPMLVFPQLIVMEAPAPLSGIEAVVGRDVLSDCLFIMDGPRQYFILAL
jgi:hypothetical protein